MPQELRAILDALRRKQEARSGGRLDKSTHSTYKAQWRMFTQFCIKNHLPDPREGLHAEILVEFLNDKATRLSNAKSWAQWTSAIYSYATKIRLLPGLSKEARDYVARHGRDCKRAVGVVSKMTLPTDSHVLKQISTKAKPTTLGRRLRIAWFQLLITKGATTRPGEVYNAKEKRALLARQISFVNPEPGLPFGALRFLLYGTKGIKLSGANKTRGEPAMAVGTGDDLCPVAAMRCIFASYGLDERPDEPVFASMREDGSRYFANPSRWTGARPMEGREYNSLLAELCKAAGVERFTGRSTRYGSSCDYEAWGVPEAVNNASGRWKPGNRAPYSSISIPGAKAIFKAREAAMSPSPTSQQR